MSKAVTSIAEAKFAAALKKDKQALSEREKARQADAKHTAKLRALRLARDAADKQEAEAAAAAKPAAKKKAKAKSKPKKAPSRPPKVY